MSTDMWDPDQDLQTMLPQVIPVFPLSGALLLPRARLPLNIFEPRYLAMVRDALDAEAIIGMVQPKEVINDPMAAPEMFDIGCLGRISECEETDDGRLLISLFGICRFRIEREVDTDTPYRQVVARYGEFTGDLAAVGPAVDVPRETLEHNLKTFLESSGLDADWHAVREAPDETLVNTLAMICPFADREKQALLEAGSLEERAAVLNALMEFGNAGHGPAGDGALH